ncbi:sugar transferase [Campylobacter lari]|nr:sugar transferase [Campylobacter lari]
MLNSKIIYNVINDTWDFDYIKHLSDCDVCDEILLLWYDLGYYDQIVTDERYVRDLALILHVDYAEFLRYLNTCLSEKKMNKSFLSCKHKFSFISYICNQEEIIRSLDVNSFAELLNTIRGHDNRLQQAFFLKNMIDFCIRNLSDILFKNGIHYIMMEILYRHFLESAAGTLYYNKLSLLVRNKFFQGRYFETKKKVALCLTGVLRPGWRDSIKDLIDSFSTFDIDVFVYSWNEESLWPGVGGNGIGWIRRFFHPIIKECPKELILSNTDFAKLFPKVFNILSNEITSKIEDKDIFILSEKIKRVKLESYSNVMQSIGDIKNDSKIYYGIYQVFRLLEEYEIQNNFKYDFIIRVRSDYKIVKNHITYDDLHKLGLNEIYSARYNCGIDGSLEIGRRSAMDTYMNTWHHISLNKNIPFFKGCFEKYPMTCMSTSGFLSHYILSQWIEYLGLRVVRLDIEFTHINHHLFENIQFPDISKELNEDLRMLRNNNVLNSSQIQDISSFFEVIFNTYTIIKNRVHLDAKIVNSEHSAKARIQNQLSYKLGQAMIVNSKSILGYIRMPFVLSYIKDKHKQEQKIYQEKIKKDLSLKLPPLEDYPDYQEALKEKECLTYKLGQALIQANKTWYGGGYIKLWFEIRKLKKKFK